MFDMGDCSMKSVGTRCEWVCEKVHIESDQDAVNCTKGEPDSKIAAWNPKPVCELQSCGKLTDGYPIFSVENDKMFAFMIYFDRDCKLPICSFGVHDSKNRVIGGIKTARTKRFFIYPCPELKKGRISSDSYTN